MLNADIGDTFSFSLSLVKIMATRFYTIRIILLFLQLVFLHIVYLVIPMNQFMKHIGYSLLYCLWLSVVMGLNPGTALAQSKEMECTPKKRANRDKVWLFESYTVLQSEYLVEQNKIRMVHGAKQDSVYFQGQSSTIVSKFITNKEGRILSPVTFDYVEDGYLLTDSIVPGKKGRSKYYFNNLLYTDALLLQVDLMKNEEWYYNPKGQDSLLIVSFEGDTSLVKWFRNGKDSLQRRWNDKRQLVEQTFDTLIQGDRVLCTKSWHPSGKLASVKFYYFEEPCLNWEYYDEKGRLVRLEKNKRLDEIAPIAYAIDPPPVKSFEVQKEKVTELFKGALNRKLSKILCRTSIKPEGSYQVQVWLEASGELSLNKLDGESAAVIGPEMETFFRELSGAKPAQRNGRPYAQLLELTLKVTDKGR